MFIIFGILYNKEVNFIQQTRLELIFVVEFDFELQTELLRHSTLFKQIYIERIWIGLLDHELVLAQMAALRVHNFEITLDFDTTTVRVYSCCVYAHRHRHRM